MKPIQERIIALDVLRGVALGGIFIVNMLDFSGSALRLNTLGSRGSDLDQLVDSAIAFFAVVKFYLLFSFLFGVGFAVQMRRAEGSGRSFVGFYLRRLAILFGIGLAHAILIWDGDILRVYAVAGVLLLLLRHRSDRALLALAGVITLAGLLFFGVAGDALTVDTAAHADTVVLFVEGSYADVVAARLARPQTIDVQLPMVLAMFLVGLVVGRSGRLDDPERYRPLLRRAWKWALPVGLAGNALLLVGAVEGQSWGISLGVHVGAPALSFVYLCAVLLNADRLRGLAPAGQMALSNYVGQSLVATTLFYGYGFGLYDRLAAWQSFALTLILFALLAGFSAMWLRHFRFGPVEWLWRTLTYGQLQPWRRAAPAGTD
ncbi:MAG: DUF418 domain-containing protein [Anaerolineae bacterium]|nr:DUF418 domain-containing protein [Anaerolineae bacterium]